MTTHRVSNGVVARMHKEVSTCEESHMEERLAWGVCVGCLQGGETYIGRYSQEETFLCKGQLNQRWGL